MCVCVCSSLPSSPSVDCNDSLYAGDQKLVAEVSKLVHTLLEQVMEYMKGLGTSIEVTVLHITTCPNLYMIYCIA